MKLFKIFFAVLVVSFISFSCEPETLPEGEPEMETQIINFEETASGNQANPIDDDKSDDE